MTRSETRLHTPGVGGRFRELEDGRFERIPEDGEAPPPARKPKPAGRGGRSSRKAEAAPADDPPAAEPSDPWPPVATGLTPDKETGHD